MLLLLLLQEQQLLLLLLLQLLLLQLQLLMQLWLCLVSGVQPPRWLVVVQPSPGREGQA